MADVTQLLAAWAKKAVAAGLGLLVLCGSASAAPDWTLVELRAKLTALSGSLKPEGELRTRSVSDLTDGLALPQLRGPMRPMAEFTEPAEPARLGWTDKRLALAALAQVYGGTDNRDVLAAGRPDDTEALWVESGVVTLGKLRSRLTQRHLGRDIETGADVLRVPLIIGEDATLRLGPGDLLHLSRADGAFIISFGRLEVFGGEISGTDDANERNDEFAPFITAVGSGSFHLSGATIRHLGFGYTAKFAGVAIVAYPTLRPPKRTIIENSRFDDLVTLALVGVNSPELRSNKFFDMRRNPLLVSRSPNTIVQGNLFSGDSPTNAIRVSNGSHRTKLVGNVVLEGSRAGLLISSGSDDVLVARNLIWRRNGGGVKLNNVRCGRVEDNIILDDRQKGVEVRSSRHSFVLHNAIIGNESAGVWVSAQASDDVTYIVDNLLRENGSGLSAAAGGGIALKGNDLSNQFPRFLDGDITQQYRAIIADLRGETPILLDAGGIRPTDQLAPEACDS